MSSTTTGWVTFIAALGMMCMLSYADVARLASWGQAFAPAFVASQMSHFAVVALAFFGGKNIPTERAMGMKTRATDRTETTEAPK